MQMVSKAAGAAVLSVLIGFLTSFITLLTLSYPAYEYETLKIAVDTTPQRQFDPCQSSSHERKLTTGAVVGADSDPEPEPDSPARRKKATRLAKSMIKTTKILAHPSEFCIRIPVFKKHPCIIVMRVNIKTAMVFWAKPRPPPPLPPKSCWSALKAKRIYLEKTMALLAVKPKRTALTAYRVEAKKRGRR